MRFRMDDGAIVDTCVYRRHWHEQRYWDGYGTMRSRSTGSADVRETLFLDWDGRYFLLSEFIGQLPACEWLDNNSAARWLLANGFKYAVQVRKLAQELRAA